jgi:hypothetical protein
MAGRIAGDRLRNLTPVRIVRFSKIAHQPDHPGFCFLIGLTPHDFNAKAQRREGRKVRFQRKGAKEESQFFDVKLSLRLCAFALITFPV